MLELPIDVFHPAPTVFPPRLIADGKVPGADLVVICLGHDRVRVVLPAGINLAKDAVADLDIACLEHRIVLAEVTAVDQWPKAMAAGPESNGLA